MGSTWKKTLNIFGIILLFQTLPFFSGAVHGEDFQVWTQLSISKAFSPSKFTLDWATENRFDMDASRYHLFNTTIGFHYDVFPWFSIGPYYRYEKKRGSPGENRFFPELVFKAKTKPIEIKNRQRFEVRFFPDETRFRYRNLTQFAHKFKTEQVSFKPFVQDEFFYEPQNNGVNENRLDVGNGFGFLNDFLNFTLYYRWQHKLSSGAWVENHILGTALGLHFK